MILDRRDQWDHEALDALVAYRGAPRQVWDNTDLGGPWLNLMRNSLNAQIWSFRHPDFLVVPGQWLEFIRSEEALEIFEQYGFARYRNTGEKATP